jgi:DNA-binding Lrp family transcriptional regulator
MDELDRRIVNALQGGIPVRERPYAEAAAALGIDEATLLARIDALLADGTLTRFGPLFDAGRLGGAFTLAAMRVPAADFERVAGVVNAFPEVAHNYAREHALNMWFVLATPAPADVDPVLAAIECATGLPVYAFPKEREYGVHLFLAA